MKQISNYKQATVADLEGNGFLEEITKIHVVSYKPFDSKEIRSIPGNETERIKQLLTWHMDSKVPMVFHNGICFDVRVFEKLLNIDLSSLMLIDSLELSWYIEPNRSQHGLDDFFEAFGIPKPKVVDWHNEPYEVYENRCVDDVKINFALWQDQMQRLENLYGISKSQIDLNLVGGRRVSEDEEIYLDQFVGNFSREQWIEKLLTFLMFKRDMAALREKTKCFMDKPGLVKFEGELGGKLQAAKEELEAVMPHVPQYSKKTPPKKPHKKDRSLSAAGVKWNDLVERVGTKDHLGNTLVEWLGDEKKMKVITKYDPPKISSPEQIKRLLFSKGWKPQTFKWVTDEDAKQAWVESGFKKSMKPKPRGIPQINRDGDDGKELCPSVQALAEEIPEIRVYEKYTVIKHRFDTVKGFLTRMGEGNLIEAGVGGLTNTLREKHRGVVNLPGIDKMYGKNIRGSFIAGEGFTLLGSDLSGLEDRTKHHFMIPHDPEYVATMMDENYDAHIKMALTANMITPKEFDEYLQGIKPDHVKAARSKGKTTNYACVYNSGAETLARSSGMPLPEAKKLLKAYWELNWAVKAIAEEQNIIQDAYGQKWLINPVNGFCYSLRKESDRFSTLCQGTGSFFFDMWINNIMTKMEQAFKTKRLSLLMHDEFMVRFKDSEKIKNIMRNITNSALEEVNAEFKLRRPLGCDVQFGHNYAEIH